MNLSEILIIDKNSNLHLNCTVLLSFENQCYKTSIISNLEVLRNWVLFNSESEFINQRFSGLTPNKEIKSCVISAADGVATIWQAQGYFSILLWGKVSELQQ